VVAVLDEDQEKEVQLLLDHTRWGLFNEQGVGKTPPVIRAVAHRIHETNLPALITVPAYLIPQWVGEIRRFAPGVPVWTMDGDGWGNRTTALQMGVHDKAIVLTSYHNWTAKPPRHYPFGKFKWSCLAFDEAHRLRGRNSQWTKAVYALDNSDSKNKGVPMWFATGTPIVHDGGDVYPFLHLCDRSIHSSYWRHVETWCHLEVTPWDRKVGPIKSKPDFYEMLSMYSSRRVLEGQEDAVFDDIPVEMPKSVRQMIIKAKKEFVFEHPDMEDVTVYESAGAVWNKIWEMVSLPPTQVNPKLDAMVGLLEDLSKERVIVACWHRSVANAALERVKKLKSEVGKGKRPCALFTGDVNAAAKSRAIREYNAHEDFAIVCTVAALKEGANLQAGNHIIFLQESVLPSENEQLIGRQRRRGQSKPVVVHRIYVKQSIDVAVHKTAQRTAADIREAMRQYVIAPEVDETLEWD
jgi:SNF2-related domain/Helicase conserved C-terminal domain